MLSETIAPVKDVLGSSTAGGLYSPLPAQVTKDITGITFADVFSAVGKKTDIIARFSLVTGPQGVPDWTRDPRGFALKFYTRQGNWDLVGNNFPVRPAVASSCAALAACHVLARFMHNAGSFPDGVDGRRSS